MNSVTEWDKIESSARMERIFAHGQRDTDTESSSGHGAAALDAAAPAGLNK